MNRTLTRLIHSEDTLHLDRPVVVLPLEEYQLLIKNAISSIKQKRSHASSIDPKLLKLLKDIQGETGKTFDTFSKFKGYMKKL